MGRSSRSFVFALTIAATACGGDAIAPSPEAAEKAKLQIITRRRTATSADITVDSKGGTFILGAHSVRFPRNSICALNSSYGPTEWDKPCTPATEPVNFHIEIVNQDGRSWLDFTPAVRFVPTTDSRSYVTLTMWTGLQGTSVTEDDLQILWSPTIGVAGIDESLTDPSLRTHYNRWNGMVSRRVKHFSAYNVQDSVMCETTDASCIVQVVTDGL